MRLVVLVVGFLLLAVAAFGSSASTYAGTGGGCSGTAGSEVHRAGLVVSFGDERPTRRFCVEFTEESISGIELLQRSGLSLVTQIEGGLGAGVCQIDGVGNDDPTNCFKYSTTPPYRYWVYFRWTGMAWQFSNVGASTRVIRDGDIDGWSWGSGAGSPPEAPGGVLDPPTPTAVPPTATLTPLPATNTPRPTATREPTQMPPGETPEPNATLVAAASQGAATMAAPGEPGGTRGSAPTPVVEPGAAVAGSQDTPREPPPPEGSTTASTLTRTPVASATPRTGVIVVDPAQARDNAATSERSDDNEDGGGSTALISFGVVAVMLAGGAGILLYRRRGAHA